MAVATTVTPYHRVEAFAFDAYQGYFRNKQVVRAGQAGASLLRTIGPLTSANTTGLRNLRLAYPNESEAWRADVLRAVWDEVGRTAGEFPHMHEFTSLGDDPSIEIIGRERFAALKQTGAVFIAGHFSNWEAMAVGLVESGVQCHVTYRPANNPLVDQRIVAQRARYGVRLQAAKGIEGGVALARALRAKETVVLMNDQKYNEGVAAPLFGHDCMTADGPTRLALRYKVPLTPLSLQRIDGQARFRMVVHEALPLDYDADEKTEIPASVARINRFMEARIREAPAQWFWVHKRWPKEAWAKAGVL